MPNVKVYDMAGQVTGEIALSEELFGAEVNKSVLHSVVRAYLINQRQGTQSTKTRSEVSGGGKKPWKQKGTGRARQGSTRSPQWTHGGIALGPKPRTFHVSVNKKVKRIALRSALSAKLADNEIFVVEGLKATEFKTRPMVEMLRALDAERKPLVVLPEVDKMTIKSFANIPGAATCQANNLNVYQILNHRKLVISKESVEVMEEVYRA
ncbi:MAG: 50S ribosomal protein L4 [Ruminococcaceae bacterium]|nr:50S ribosomal protein L4 [Oscillospiraceae bacterium]